MMPKGVEHLLLRVVKAVRVHVKIPMMPKGVEHAKDDTSVKVSIS